jgi:hypothetical protein
VTFDSGRILSTVVKLRNPRAASQDTRLLASRRFVSLDLPDRWPATVDNFTSRLAQNVVKTLDIPVTLERDAVAAAFPANSSRLWYC